VADNDSHNPTQAKFLPAEVVYLLPLDAQVRCGGCDVIAWTSSGSGGGGFDSFEAPREDEPGWDDYFDRVSHATSLTRHHHVTLTETPLRRLLREALCPRTAVV